MAAATLPADFANAAAPAAVEPTGLSPMGMAFVLATEFIVNAFMHFNPTGLSLSAAFADAMGWVASPAEMGASTATVGGTRALVF